MKTKLLVLFTSILTLSSVSSCVVPYNSGRSYRRPSHHSSYGHYRNTRGNVGGYRGGGNGGGFGGNFGGF